jgi:hypothetical protein
MRTAFLISFLALATGCDQPSKVTMQLAGWDTAILSSQPFELNPQRRTFTSTKQMKALGISSVCVVLKTSYPMAPQPQMDRDFESLLQGEDILATLIGVNGTEYRLTGANQAWSSDGPISSSEELSACVSNAGGVEIPEGTVIKSVQIQSDKPLAVLGAYWQSMPKVSGPEG